MLIRKINPVNKVLLGEEDVLGIVLCNHTKQVSPLHSRRCFPQISR